MAERNQKAKMPSLWRGVPSRACVLPEAVLPLAARRGFKPGHIQQELWGQGTQLSLPTAITDSTGGACTLDVVHSEVR